MAQALRYDWSWHDCGLLFSAFIIYRALLVFVFSAVDVVLSTNMYM